MTAVPAILSTAFFIAAVLAVGALLSLASRALAPKPRSSISIPLKILREQFEQREVKRPTVADTALSNVLSALLMDEDIGDAIALPVIARRHPRTAVIEVVVGRAPGRIYAVAGNVLTPIGVEPEA